VSRREAKRRQEEAGTRLTEQEGSPEGGRQRQGGKAEKRKGSGRRKARGRKEGGRMMEQGRYK